MPDRDMPEFDELETDIMKNARKINSLSGQVEKLTNGDVRRISPVKGEEELVSTTVKVMRKMGQAVETMATGMKNVTVGSLKYTKEALSQYSKAIGEDISVDKKSLIALSLAKATPVFGYFAAKFMETDVFRRAAQNIKDKMSEAVSFVGDRFKSILTAPFRGIKSLLSRKKSPADMALKEPKTGRRGVFVERGGELTFHPIGKSKMAPMKIPRMQVGGYVERGGLTRLHPAEVVMPIDKLLDRIDEKIESESDVRMNKMMRGVTIQQARMMKRYMKTQEKVQTKSFSESYKTQYKTFIEPFNEKLIDAFTDLKTALLGHPNDIMVSLRLMWQRFFTKHPLFLALFRFGNIFLKTLTWPIRFIFKKRGGKFRWVASRSKNPIISTAETLARFAPAAMGHFDNILTILKDSLIVQKDLVSFFTGRIYGPTILKGTGKWSFAGVLKNMFMGDVRRFGRWGRAAGRKLGLFGVEEAPEEATPITMADRIDTMIDLLKEIAECSCRSTKDVTFKDYVKKDSAWQRRSLDVEKRQLQEQKKHRGFFGRMRDSLSFIGLKIKNLAIRIGKVVMKGISKTISWAKEAIDTILAFIPGWLKLGLVAVLIPIVGNKLAKIFDEKVLPTIDKYMGTMISSTADMIRRALRGEKSAEEFKKEEVRKKKEILERGKEMKEAGVSPREISEFVQRKIKEEQIGVSLAGRYETFVGEDLGLFRTVDFKIRQAKAKTLKLITMGFIDEETSMRNLMEEIQKGTMDPEKAGSIYLAAMKKKMSPEAFTILTKAGPTASAVDNFRTLMANKSFYNDQGTWISQDEWFKKRAGFKDKTVARVGKIIDGKSFGVFKLEEQFKEAKSRELKAIESAELMEKRYAEYMSDKMTPEAYRLLTADGLKGISDRLSTMIANNQLIDYEGKLNTAYQFLKKTDKLTWKDRFRYMFGFREISPAEMIDKLGIKSLMTKEMAEKHLQQFMPFSPYQAVSDTDLKTLIKEGGPNTISYVQELMNRLPKDQFNTFMRAMLNNPAFVKATGLAEDVIGPVIDKSELAMRQAKSEISKQLATIQANKRLQAGAESIKETAGNLANIMSNTNNILNNNTTNNVSSQSQQRRDLYSIDPEFSDLTTGDLK